MSDLRAKVEGLPWAAMAPEPSLSLTRAAVLALSPEGAVLVTEETLAVAMRASRESDEREGLVVTDPDKAAAAILARLREPNP